MGGRSAARRRRAARGAHDVGVGGALADEVLQERRQQLEAVALLDGRNQAVHRQQGPGEASAAARAGTSQGNVGKVPTGAAGGVAWPEPP